MKYSEVTEKIIGCAFKVHSTLGNGFQEVIYPRAPEIELKKCGLSFVREYEMPVYYDGYNIGSRRVDFLVEGKIRVELKALVQLQDVHLAQGHELPGSLPLRNRPAAQLRRQKPPVQAPHQQKTSCRFIPIIPLIS